MLAWSCCWSLCTLSSWATHKYSKTPSYVWRSRHGKCRQGNADLLHGKGRIELRYGEELGIKVSNFPPLVPSSFIVSLVSEEYTSSLAARPEAFSGA